MPRITRKQQKIFAENASNNGVFGSLQSNDPVTSSDPATLQGRAAFLNGWNDATYSAELLPPLEEFQAIQYIVTRQLAYILQEGISEWDSNTTYYKGSMVKVISGDAYTLFESIVDNNTGNQTTDTTKWKVCGVSEDFNTGMHYWRADVTYGLGDWVRGVDANGNPDIFQSLQANNKGNAVTNSSYWSALCVGRNGFPLLSWLPYDHELNDTSWLRADNWTWHDGTMYTSAYNALVSAQTGGTAASETVGSYTISYALASNGWKIVDVANAGTVEDIYDETGVAWYYIIDTANQQFKLPRTKHGFVGLRDTVGKYVPETLPNITGRLDMNAQANTSGVGTGAVEWLSEASSTGGSSGTSYQRNAGFTFDASRVSSTYQNDAPVQERSTQMYLYFYVGNTVRNQTEIDVGEMTEALSKKWDSSNMVVTTELPVNPQTGVFYFIK